MAQAQPESDYSKNLYRYLYYQALRVCHTSYVGYKRVHSNSKDH